MDVVQDPATESAIVLAEQLLDLSACPFFIAAGGVEGQMCRVRHEEIVVEIR
jgi:hypothetical protein